MNMTKEEYKQGQHTLGFDARYSDGKPLSEWLDTLGISEPTHKRYTTGSGAISPTVERLINALLRIQQLEQQLESLDHTGTNT